jgi:hypothetical protein
LKADKPLPERLRQRIMSDESDERRRDEKMEPWLVCQWDSQSIAVRLAAIDDLYAYWKSLSHSKKVPTATSP